MNKKHNRPSAKRVRQNKTETFKTEVVHDNEQALSEDRLEGRNPIQEALKAGRTIDKLWVAKRSGAPDPGLVRLVQKAKEQGAVVVETERLVLDRMAETQNHQGLIAQVAVHDYLDLDKMITQAFDKTNQPMLLVLAELKDSYNLGSILRIADAAGVQGIIIPQRRSVTLNAAVAKASAGAIEYVPAAKVTNLTNTLTQLKDKGFWIAGTDAEGKSDYHTIDWKGPMAIVIGSEGEGLGPAVKKQCDFLLSIPMQGRVNSLNAAVATGIIVFEAMWQRQKI